MMRKLITLGALSGALAIGTLATGTLAAGAQTTGAPGTVGGTAGTAGAAVAGKSAAIATTGPTTLPGAVACSKAHARETKATTGGHADVAARISRRITRVQRREARGDALLAKIAARCGDGSSAS
jgi:hypothetical protein